MTGQFVSIPIALLTLAIAPALAQPDDIPETTGFSGYALLSGAYFNVATNIIVGSEPITLDPVSDSTIESIFEAPTFRSTPGVMGGGEVNYTFGKSRTQIFLGNRLEDLLRMDVVFGLGVRQQFGKAGIVAASFLFTPVDLQHWSDPYVEGEPRESTYVDLPGFRLRWGQVFGTGLEITIDDRFYEYQEETSGDWLVDEGRLAPEDRALLNRDGDILRIQALYRIDVAKRHRFEPAIRWVDDYHKGRAIANDGFTAQLTYIFRSPKVLIDANLVVGQRDTKEINPIYDTDMNSTRWAVGFTAFVPVKKFKSSVLSVLVGAEVFEEDVNVDFYDSTVRFATVGLIWNHLKK